MEIYCFLGVQGANPAEEIFKRARSSLKLPSQQYLHTARRANRVYTVSFVDGSVPKTVL